jgi:hypothetical protein
MAAPPPSQLDSSQILQAAFDESTGRLRTDAVSGGVGQTVIVKDSGGDELLVNPDGSINSNVEIDAAGGDNIIAVGTEDGTFGGVQHPLKIGSDGNLRVKDTDALTVLSSIDGKLVGGNDIGDVTVNNTLLNPVIVSNSNLDVALSTRASEATLSTLNSKFVSGTDIGDVTVNNTSLNPIPVDIQNVNVDIRDIVATQDNILTAGTINGSTSGTVYYNVSNLKTQILATHDRNQAVTYADAGTVNQRVTQIDYSSPTFPGFTARKSISYTPIGNGYIVSNITWSIV